MRICISQVERKAAGCCGQFLGWERKLLCNRIFVPVKDSSSFRGVKRPSRGVEADIYVQYYVPAVWARCLIDLIKITLCCSVL